MRCAGETAKQIWSEQRSEIANHLEHLLHQEEPTEGSAELSRSEHAQKATDLLSNLDVVTDMMKRQMTSKTDRRWLDEVIAEIVMHAFSAGRRTQAAWGKEFEHLAVAREKQIFAFSNANYARTDYYNRRKYKAAAWKSHAREVEKIYPSKRPIKSERARNIYRNWANIGSDEEPPERPKVRTIQNWLSNRK